MNNNHHPFSIKFQSKNIDFVEVSYDLIPQYLEISNNRNISQGSFLYPRKYTEEEKREWVEKKLKAHAETFSMIERKSGKFIGIIEFYLNGIPESRLLGIAILEEFQNQKYGTEAIAKMIEFGFHKLNLENIHLIVFSNNKKAIHCYKKLGFVEYKVDKDIGIQNNEFIDDIFMKIESPVKYKKANQCKPSSNFYWEKENICYDSNKGENIMKFTDNFSEETQSKAELLAKKDRQEKQEQLVSELIEQMDPYLQREEDKYRVSGMTEEAINTIIKKRKQEILENYKESVESLQKGINTLQMLNEMYAKKEEITEKKGR